MAEVSPAQTQVCGRAAAGAVAAVPSRGGTAVVLALLLHQRALPTPPPQGRNIWSAQALLRLLWWQALRLQPALRLEPGLWQEASRAHQPPEEAVSSRLVFPKGRTWAAQGAPLSRRRWPTLRAGSVCWGWDETAKPEHGSQAAERAKHLFLRSAALEEPGGCSTIRGLAGFVARATRSWYPAQGQPAPGNANQGLAEARAPVNTGNETKQNKTKQHVAYWSAPSLPCDCTTCTSYISERGATSPYCDGFLKFKSFTCY